jgi:tetratricopeptide (TPR) repeat protein
VPLWLNEGLAEYFSELPVEKGNVRLGSLTRRVELFNRSGVVIIGAQSVMAPVETLLRLDNPAGLTNYGYLSAYALVHYLANGGPDHAQRFRRFLVAIVEQGKPVREELIAEYGPLEQLEKAYWAHFQQMTAGQTLTWFISYTPPPDLDARLAFRTLDDGEIHAINAILRPETSQDQLAQATQHAYRSASLHRWRAILAEGEQDPASAAREMDEAVSCAGDDPFFRYERFRLRLAEQLRRPPDARAWPALAREARAVARTVHEAPQLAILGFYFLVAGEAAMSATFAERAVRLEPHCAGCLVTLAQVYFARGDASEAVDALETGLRRWPRFPPTPPFLQTRLEAYRCALRRQNEPELTCPTVDVAGGVVSPPPPPQPN